MKAPFLLGRLIFGGFFIYSGIHHFTNRKQMSQYVAAKKVPLPDVAVTSSGGVLILGGASILLGVKPKYGAAALAGFLLGISPVMHDFWTVADPNQRMNEMVNFTKNLALAGGALALMGLEEPWSDQRPCRTAQSKLSVKAFCPRLSGSIETL
jgi:putative oxidoreductase